MNLTIFVTSIYHGKMHEHFLKITIFYFFNNSQLRLLLVKMSIKKSQEMKHLKDIINLYLHSTGIEENYYMYQVIRTLSML